MVGQDLPLYSHTRKKRRAHKNTRKELSRWSRGRQEQYLGEKTGLKIEYVPEHYTTQSCPKRGVRKNPRVACLSVRTLGGVENAVLAPNQARPSLLVARRNTPNTSVERVSKSIGPVPTTRLRPRGDGNKTAVEVKSLYQPGNPAR